MYSYAYFWALPTEFILPRNVKPEHFVTLVISGVNDNHIYIHPERQTNMTDGRQKRMIIKRNWDIDVEDWTYVNLVFVERA